MSEGLDVVAAFRRRIAELEVELARERESVKNFAEMYSKLGDTVVYFQRALQLGVPDNNDRAAALQLADLERKARR